MSEDRTPFDIEVTIGAAVAPMPFGFVDYVDRDGNAHRVPLTDAGPVKVPPGARGVVVTRGGSDDVEISIGTIGPGE